MLEITNNINLLCRSCAAPHYGEKVDLFGTPILTEIYVRLSGSQADKKDLLPKQICLTCYHRLDDFNRFQKMCSESYEILSSNFKAIDECIVIKDEKPEISEIEIDTPKIVETLPTSPTLARTDSNANINQNKGHAYDSNPADVVLYTIHDSSGSRSDANGPVYNDEPPLLEEMTSRNGNEESAGEKLPVRTSGCMYRCSKCPKTFRLKLSFEGHIRAHKGLRPFPCDKCDKSYSRLDHFKSHVGNAHPDEIKTFPCFIYGCDKEYTKRDAFKMHMKRKHNCVCCETCKLLFETRATLDQHIKDEHSKKNRFKCSLCPKDFLKKGSLDSHLEIHKTRSLKKPDTHGKPTRKSTGGKGLK